MSTRTTASTVCGCGAWSAALSTYHLAKKPIPPTIGKPSSASMNTAIAQREPRAHAPEPGVVVDLLIALAGLAERDDHGEGADRRERVRERGRTETPTRRATFADDDRDEQIARVRDARVREHALDVLLRERDDVADDHRGDREPLQRDGCHAAVAAGNASSHTRRNAAKAAAFTAAAMYAVIGVGAPS